MLAAFMLSALPIPSLAQLPPPPTYTAPQFQHDCQQEAGEGRDRCINYLGGMIDLQRHAMTLGEGVAVFCPPLYLSAEHARQAYLKWAKDNPYMVVGPPIASITMAFQQNYQCQQ